MTKRPLWAVWIIMAVIGSMPLAHAIAAPTSQDDGPTPSPTETVFRGPTATSTPTLQPPPADGGRVAASNLAVRSLPSIDAPLLGRLPYNAVVIPIGRTDNAIWVAIEFDERIAWVSAPNIIWSPSLDLIDLPVLGQDRPSTDNPSSTTLPPGVPSTLLPTVTLTPSPDPARQTYTPTAAVPPPDIGGATPDLDEVEGCSVPGSTILDPQPGETLSGVISISGESNVGSFAGYKLELRGVATNDVWVVIGTYEEAVERGVLGEWDSTGFPAGQYEIRLVTNRTDNTYLPPCVVPLTIIVSDITPVVDSSRPTVLPPWTIHIGVGLLLMAVLSYGWVYSSGRQELKRYREGFILKDCPVCHSGLLELDEKIKHTLGIPRAVRSVRCSNCRSVLREIEPGAWRYTVDASRNPELAEQYNGQAFKDEELLAFVEVAQQHAPKAEEEVLIEAPADAPTPEEIISQLEARYVEEVEQEQVEQAVTDGEAAENEADQATADISDEAGVLTQDQDED